MRHSYTIFLVAIWAFVNAQQPPNFSMTDTHGNEWNLYTELGKGKVVVLDFFFVDCKPCQRYTPMIQSIYESHGEDTGSVVVFGISNRDANSRVIQFESDFGVTYPSCGNEGGGDTITDMFQLNYSFLSWPTYAVICPDTTIVWDIIKTDSFQTLQDTMLACPEPILSAFNPSQPVPNVLVWYNMTNNTIVIDVPKNSTIECVSIYDVRGKLVQLINSLTGNSKTELKFNQQTAGLYYVQVQLETKMVTTKILHQP